MEWKLMTVYDTKAGIYDRPFVARSNGEAIRGFSDAINDAKTTIGKHPEDFNLMEIGIYNDQTGEVDRKKITCLITGSNCKVVENGE